MTFTQHPLWLAGFRPFFALAAISGMSLPLLWALIFTGVVPAPATPFSPIQWHAHEMFYGFGWAVLGGFLLTSTKNWVKIRGYHGGALVALAAAWLAERIAIAAAGRLPAALFWLLANAYLAGIVALLLASLLRHRANDAYRADNRFFLVALPLFLPAKFLLLSTAWSEAGESMTLALFRLAFLIMLERTLSQFMKGALQLDILRHPGLDRAIKFGALALVAEAFFPAPLAAGLALVVALLLAYRLAFWHPLAALRRIDIGIMHIGYAMIVVQLVLQAFDRLALTHWVGSAATHTFTFGVMGLIVPAMLIRISKGHTGRKVVFEAGDKAVLWIMLAALAVRVVAPQAAPGAYTAWVHLAATGWFAGFGLLAWRIIPFLLQARIDGKEH